MRTIINTPWGVSQAAREIAPGLVKHTTASHGGYELSPQRWERFQSIFPAFVPYAGARWFEEDEDWAAVVLAFPAYFGAHTLRAAVQSATNATRRPGSRFETVTAWLGSPAGRDILRTVAQWTVQHQLDWEPHGGGTNGGGWRVAMVQVGTGIRKWVVMRNYPEKNLYTTEELTAMELPLCQLAETVA